MLVNLLKELTIERNNHANDPTAVDLTDVIVKKDLTKANHHQVLQVPHAAPPIHHIQDKTPPCP